MTLEIRPGITIRRPRREVAAVIFDPRYNESWLETLRPLAPDDEAPSEDPAIHADADAPDGALRTCLIRFLLRDVIVELRETSRDPERFVEYEADEPYQLWVRQDLESIPEGTLARIRIRVRLTGLPRLLSALVRRRLRRSVIGDLEALKALVENSPHRGVAAPRPATPPAGAGQLETGIVMPAARAASEPVAEQPPAASGAAGSDGALGSGGAAGSDGAGAASNSPASSSSATAPVPPPASHAPVTAPKASIALGSVSKLPTPLKPAKRVTPNW